MQNPNFASKKLFDDGKWQKNDVKVARHLRLAEKCFLRLVVQVRNLESGSECIHSCMLCNSTPRYVRPLVGWLVCRLVPFSLIHFFYFDHL